jgi:hypothetical protein
MLLIYFQLVFSSNVDLDSGCPGRDFRGFPLILQEHSHKVTQQPLAAPFHILPNLLFNKYLAIRSCIICVSYGVIK